MAKLEFLRISRRGSFCLDKTPVLASLAALEPPRSLTDWPAHRLYWLEEVLESELEEVANQPNHTKTNEN